MVYMALYTIMAHGVVQISVRHLYDHHVLSHIEKLVCRKAYRDHGLHGPLSCHGKWEGARRALSLVHPRGPCGARQLLFCFGEKCWGPNNRKTWFDNFTQHPQPKNNHDHPPTIPI